MNPEPLLKVEQLEKLLPRWEKWLFACGGATLTLLANAIIRGIERPLLIKAFFLLTEDKMPLVPLNPASNILISILNAPWWSLLWFLLEVAALGPAMILAVHPTWRKVPLAKRLNLMFGYFLAAWLVLLSLVIQDPANVAEGYYVLLVISAPLLGLGYWWLRRKEKRAEELFP